MKKTIKINSEESGQAVLELAFVVVMMCILVFGVIDFGRAIYDQEVMKNLAGEGSSMASRGTPAVTAASTLVTYADSDINVASKGCIVITTISNLGGTPPVITITGQVFQGSISGCGPTSSTNTNLSRIGCYTGTNCVQTTTMIPTAAKNALTNEPVGSSIYATEIFYTYSTVSPVMGLLHTQNLLPTDLYSVAYY